MSKPIPDPSRWRVIDTVFSRLLDAPEADRAGLLERLCAGDEELRSAVEELLETAARASDLLDGETRGRRDRLLQAALADDDSPDGFIEDLSGMRLGPWRLERRLARGGYATVYVGARVDGAYAQQVAVKILRRGLDTGDVLRRFAAERQILSSLQHAGIARLLDGGTTDDGRPYLVMEHVDGLPVTEYCRAKNCSVEQRVELLIRIATVVQHAHRHLVVHRDLKPSNILVTGNGEVRLLDFGIAKLLDQGQPEELAVRTRTGCMPLTPDYASPEQLQGLPVTTASDVYQLGVLMYKVLTGHRPFESERTGPGEARRTVTPPRSLSALVGAARPETRRLARRLHGDLDRIAIKAMMPEPGLRYATAAEIAGDLRNHLDGLPVSARPATVRYRLSKLLGRKPWLAPVVALLVVIAAAYVLTLRNHARELEAKTALAERSQQFLVDVFRSPDPFTPADPDRGREITVAEALRIGADRVATDLAAEPALQASLLGTISQVYRNLDLRDEALRLRLEALAIERKVYGEASPEVVDSLIAVASLYAGLDELERAEGLRREALELAARAYGPDDPALGHVEVAIGTQHRMSEQNTLAVEWLTRGIEHLERTRPLKAERLMWAHYELATAQMNLGAYAAALAAAERAYALSREIFGEDSLHSAEQATGVARVQALTGDYEASEALYSKAIPVLDRALGRDHRTTLVIRNNLAVLHMESGDFVAAESLLREVLEIRLAMASGKPSLEIADALQNLAVTLSRQDRSDEAIPELSRAHQMYREVLPAGHPRIALPLLSQALAELRLDRAAAARTSAESARASLAESLPADHFLVAVADCLAARAAEALGQPADPARPLAAAWAILGPDPRVPASYRSLCSPD